jgi:3D (Asp-Asp-Asp) domain-containing protein
MKQLFVILFLSGTVFASEKEYEAIITHYCSCEKCCSWHYENGKAVFNSNNKPKIVGKTASGTMATEGRTLALPKSFPFKSIVKLSNGETLGIVEDRGGAIVELNNKIKIDVYISSHKKALELGKYTTKIVVIVP